MVEKPPVQKLRSDQNVTPEISDKQIDLIGRVIVLWSKLEAALDDTIWLFLGLDFEDGKIATKRLSADAKIQMLKALGPHHIPDETLLKTFNETLGFIDELKESRNFIAHGVWGTMMPDDVHVALSLKPKSEIGEVVSESFPTERMEAIADGIRKMLQRLVNLPESLMKEDTFRKTTASLEVYFEQLLRHVEQPKFVKDKTYPSWRFPNEGVAEAALLKGARIIGALNALIILIRGGYVQEMGVIYRTIDEFFTDIAFLLEGFPNKDLSALQRQFLDDFYQEEFDKPENPLESTQKRKTVKRQKMYAAAARMLSDIIDPQQAQELFRTIGKANSGYVHGAYPHIMELYGGNPPKFHLEGMLNSPRADDEVKNSINYFYRGIHALMLIAMAFENPPVFDGLMKVRAEFEKETGYIPTNTLGKVIHLRDGTKKTKKGT